MPRRTIPDADRQMNRVIGRCIAARRRELKLSAAHLEETLMLRRGGLARLERGDKGLDAGLLIALSEILSVDVNYFFSGLPLRTGKPPPTRPPPDLVDEIDAFLTKFHKIESDAERRILLALMRAVVDSGAARRRGRGKS